MDHVTGKHRGGLISSMVGFRSSNDIISIPFISVPLSYNFFYLNLILSQVLTYKGKGDPEGK